MKLNDDVLILALTTDFGSGPAVLHPSVILDSEAGLTLVDAGIPGMEDAINAALGEIGASLKDIKRVLITHHDLDHIGSLPAVVAASGAEVWAPEREISFIEGNERPQKMPPQEQIAALLADPNTPAQMRIRLSTLSVKVKVDRALKDGEVLPIAGGVRVVFTPGHTVGHTSFYLERSKTLITGDAASSDKGQLRSPPAPPMTADMKTAGESVSKLAGLDVQSIVAYHGGAVTQDAGEQLKRLTTELNH